MKLFSIPGISGRSKFRRLLRENTIDSLTAEVWAREAMEILQTDLVYPNINAVDFSDQVGKWGDVVNINTIGEFHGGRKGALCETIIQEDLTAGTFQIDLNQFLYVSFKICDGEENRPLRDLIQTYLPNATRALVELMDGAVISRYVDFLDNDHVGGHLGGLSSTNAGDYLLDTSEAMDLNKAPSDGRKIVLSPRSKTSFLKNQQFVSAEKAGTDRALRKGLLGELYNVDTFTAYESPFVNPQKMVFTDFAVNNAAGYSAGSTSIAVDIGSAAALPTGSWVVIAGDDTPQQVTTGFASATSGTMTISPGLKRSVADNAIVRTVKTGTLTAAAYAGPQSSPVKKYGYAKRIRVDGVPTGITPQAGQFLTFGTTIKKYVILQTYTKDTTGADLGSGIFEIVLDSPLEAAVADNTNVNLGPSGSYNWMTAAGSLAIAVRPLPKPRTGSLSSVVNDSGYSIRVVISYDFNQQAHIVTLDTLMGVHAYNINKGAVLLG